MRGPRRRARNFGGVCNAVAWSVALRIAVRPPHPRFARPLPARGERWPSPPVLAARLSARGLQKPRSRILPHHAGVQRREAPKSWPRHAGECYHSLALRARRAPQDNPLARTACFGRAAPPGAPPRLLRPGGRPASAWKPHSLPPPTYVCRRRPSERDFDSPYVTDIGTSVKGLSLKKIPMAFLGPRSGAFIKSFGRRRATVRFAPKADKSCMAAK